MRPNKKNRAGGVFWKKTMVKGSCALDMKRLAKDVDSESEGWTYANWKSTWGRHTMIGISICPPNRIRLEYATTKRSTGEQTKHEYYVYLETTPCNYGGKRWWFLCPNCNRRCRVLYLPPGETYFACRICHNLSYESQQEGRNMWHYLFKAMEEGIWLEQNLHRIRSPRRRAIIERNLNRYCTGLETIIDWGKKGKKGK